MAVNIGKLVIFQQIMENSVVRVEDVAFRLLCGRGAAGAHAPAPAPATIQDTADRLCQAWGKMCVSHSVNLSV